MCRMRWILLALTVVAALVVAGCDGDDGGVDRSFDAASWGGTWDGDWVNQTFGSTGGATFDVAVNAGARTVDLTIDLDGPVFGQTDPAPIQVSLQYTDDGINAAVDSTELGNIAVTIDEDGNIQGAFTNVPAAAIDRVTFTGRRVGDSITINYAVEFAGGGNPANGVLSVTLQ